MLSIRVKDTMDIGHGNTDQLKRPERLLIALIGISVIAIDLIAFGDSSPMFLISIAALFLVAVGGSFAPYDDSIAFLIFLLLSQVAIAVFIALMGHYALTLIVVMALLDTGYGLWHSISKGKSG